MRPLTMRRVFGRTMSDENSPYPVSAPSEQKSVTAFALTGSPSLGVLQQLRYDTESALASGVESLAIDIDALVVLESVTIAALISILRAARERAARVTLRADRQHILETLAVTGLNKIFSMEPPLLRP